MHDVQDLRPAARLLIAPLTARSGRCVVASATRSSPATSNITGSGTPVRSARYSVWPVNGMPASLMTLFCTRRGHDGVELAAGGARDGPVQHVQHLRGVGRVQPAGLDRRGAGQMQHRQHARRDAAAGAAG